MPPACIILLKGICGTKSENRGHPPRREDWAKSAGERAGGEEMVGEGGGHEESLQGDTGRDADHHSRDSSEKRVAECMCSRRWRLSRHDGIARPFHGRGVVMRFFRSFLNSGIYCLNQNGRGTSTDARSGQTLVGREPCRV